MSSNQQTITHRVRMAQPKVEQFLREQGFHPLLARLMAARGVDSPQEAHAKLSDLLNPLDMKTLYGGNAHGYTDYPALAD